MARGDSQRDRRSVRIKAVPVGYLTAIRYPDRDLTAFSEGSPYSELVIADLAEDHVALLQRFKEHWLVRCGEHYTTTERSGELSDARAMQLARLALHTRHFAARPLMDALKAQLDAWFEPRG